MRRFLVAATILVLAAAGTQLVTHGGGGTGDGEPIAATARVAALRTFAACDDVLEHLRSEAADRVGAWGLEGGQGWFAFGDDVAVMEGAAEAGGTTGGDGLSRAADTAAAPQAGRDYSTTNVQEVGVDEPDTVKTDGDHLYTVSQGRLRVLDISGAEPRVIHDGALGDGNSWDHQLLLSGDRLLVLSTGWRMVRGQPPVEPAADAARGLGFAPHAEASVTTATLYDVNDPANPTEIERLDVDGWKVAARMIDGVARLVVRSDPARVPWAFPLEGTEDQVAAAERENQAVAARSSLTDWLPTSTHSTRNGDVVATAVPDGPMVACDKVHHPIEFSGFGALSVLSLDLQGGLDDHGAVTVLAGGDTVYASATSLYVATTRWFDPAAEETAVGTTGAEDTVLRMPVPAGTLRTDLHVFDITDPAGAVYRGSGSVPGHLLNQFAMSEHEGHLRVATTTDATAGAVSQSAVRVLELQGDRLTEIGAVEGLGLDERIYSVRYIGDVAYVVTFRETDPLYTVDLSDPTAPRVRGELKILGYSAYLHPVGDGLLLGIGQDATEEGQRLGTQVSLFDVSDLDDPRRIANTTVAQGYSDAEYDHHAFTWWAPTGLAMIPVNTWTETGGSWAGAMGFTVDVEARSLDRLGQVSHDVLTPQLAPGPAGDAIDPMVAEEMGVAIAEGWVPPISRSVVIGDAVYTLSDLGLVVADLADLDVRSSLVW